MNPALRNNFHSQSGPEHHGSIAHHSNLTQALRELPHSELGNQFALSSNVLSDPTSLAPGADHHSQWLEIDQTGPPADANGPTLNLSFVPDATYALPSTVGTVSVNEYSEPWSPWRPIDPDPRYQTYHDLHSHRSDDIDVSGFGNLGFSAPGYLQYRHQFDTRSIFHDRDLSHNDDLGDIWGSPIERGNIAGNDNWTFRSGDGPDEERSNGSLAGEMNLADANSHPDYLMPTQTHNWPSLHPRHSWQTQHLASGSEAVGRSTYQSETLEPQYSSGQRPPLFAGTQPIPIPVVSPHANYATHVHEEIAFSWPPGPGHIIPGLDATFADSVFPEHEPASLESNRRLHENVAIEKDSAQPRQSTLAMRPKKRRNSTRKSISSGTNEKKIPVAPSRGPARKGGRTGKLPERQATEVAKKRLDKNVCIPCRLRRVKCINRQKGDIIVPCDWCLKHESECVTASFTDISDRETMNCVFQTYCVYPSLDNSSRICLRYSSNFELHSILEILSGYCETYDIRVQSFAGFSWTIDLAMCKELLAKLNSAPRSRPLQLQEMVEGRGVKAWKSCIRPMDQELSSFEQYYRYTNMPSRNAYSLIALHDGPGTRPLDVDDVDDRKMIGVVIRLARVILRALEMQALRDLQARLADVTRGIKTEVEIEKIVHDVARLLGSLRWRVVWWQAMETGVNTIHFTHRTTALARILYFWYFAAIKRLPSNMASQLPRTQSAVYADVGEIEEDLPDTETPKGFELWMLKAHPIIQEHQARGSMPALQDRPFLWV